MNRFLNTPFGLYAVKIHQPRGSSDVLLGAVAAKVSKNRARQPPYDSLEASERPAIEGAAPYSGSYFSHTGLSRGLGTHSRAFTIS